MISSADSCRQLVAGNYDVIFDDEDIASLKSALTNFLNRFEHHENELLFAQQQQQQQQLADQQHSTRPELQPTRLTTGSYVNEFRMLKELSRALKENSGNFIDGLECYNQSKNRYKDIIPFNHTRVVLSCVPQLEPGSDYINANFVRGPSHSPRSYIACQGPLPHTLNDFWRMIWECRVSVIVMACNEQEMGRSKCEQYWPRGIEESLVFGNIQVKLTRVRQINSDFLIRKFSVQLLEPEAEVANVANNFSSRLNNSPASTSSNDTRSQVDEQVQHQHPNDHNNNNLDAASNAIPIIKNGNSYHVNKPLISDNGVCAFGNGGGSCAATTASTTSNDSIYISDSDSASNQLFYNQTNCKPTFVSSSHRGRPPHKTNSRAVIMERTVCQFHFQGWQDHGVPDSVQSILELVRLIREVQPGYNSSILIHCSAGCGRTGTICCIDYVYGLMRMGKLDANFDLFTIIREMRQQRMAMVQTIEQYILCHRAVATLFMQQLQMLGLHNGNRFVPTVNGKSSEEENERGEADEVEEEKNSSHEISDHSSSNLSKCDTSSSSIALANNDKDTDGEGREQKPILGCFSSELNTSGQNGDSPSNGLEIESSEAEDEQELGPVFI